MALGQLIGSNRQFIQDAIPHIGSLLRDEAADVVGTADVVVVTTKEIPAAAVGAIDDHHIIINVATLESPKQERVAQAVAGR